MKLCQIQRIYRFKSRRIRISAERQFFPTVERRPTMDQIGCGGPSTGPTLLFGAAGVSPFRCEPLRAGCCCGGRGCKVFRRGKFSSSSGRPVHKQRKPITYIHIQKLQYTEYNTVSYSIYIYICMNGGTSATLQNDAASLLWRGGATYT